MESNAAGWSSQRGEYMDTSENKPVQIGELAKTLAITTRTIRYYEEIGLMGKNNRLGGSTRSYGRDDVLRLKFILKLKNLGISLKEIQELSDIFDINEKDFSKITPKLIEILDNHITRVDEKMASLLSLRKDIVDYRVRITDYLASRKTPH
jgi:DNA-binding transcriptional MerR regulator